MTAGGSADTNNINVRVGKNYFQGIVGLAAVFSRKSIGFLFMNIVNTD
jgi:hypothetical protein